MRKVIFAINVSIDGFVGHTTFMPAEDVFQYYIDLVHDIDLVAYGRKMYQIMFPYWADEANWDSRTDAEFAKRLTSLDKVVFSRTLDSADYNARVVGTDPIEELQKLKQAPGGNILVNTVSMLPQFAQAGLIDEYRFVIYPGFVGQGPRLVESGTLVEKLNLQLIESKAFKSGTVALHYAKRA